MNHIRLYRLFEEKWFAFLAIFLGYLVVAHLSGYLYRGIGESSSVILSPAGVGLAAVVIDGYIALPAIALAAVVNGFINGMPLILIAGSAIGSTLQAYVAYTILRLIGFDRKLAKVKDMFGLVLVALLASLIVPGMSQASAWLYTAVTGIDRAAPPFVSLWIGGALSMLVLAPFLIRWIRRTFTPRTRPQYFEALIVICLVAISSYFLFATSQVVVYGVSLALVLFASLFWLAFRSGPRFMTLALFVMTVISFLGAIYGTYEMPEGGIAMRIFTTQIFDLLVALFFFILVSLEEQRKNAVQRLSEQNLKLQGTIQTIHTETMAKNEFIATLAHELRNPLAPLLTSVETLRLNTPPQSDTSKTLDLMHTQIRTMGYLLDDLLDIARITQRKFALKKALHDLEAVVRKAVQVTAPAIAQHSHQLSVTLPERSHLVEIDGLRTEQIIINLLHNAAKYTPDGGKIHLEVDYQGGEIYISVLDNGIGVKPEMMDRIFEPFVQVPNPDRLSGGIGIGLALTKNLVEMHGGTIAVQHGKGGKGSEFIVRIPAEGEELQVLRRPAAVRRTASNTGLSILIVDDNQGAANSMQKLLDMRGHHTQVAYDGASALNLLATTTPDVVLLDIGLPDMDGYEVAGRIRAAGLATVIVALTGYGQSDDKRRAEDAGFDHHLTKPVGLADLEAVLSQVGSKSSR